MCSLGINRMCVGAFGLTSRNATTESEAYTMSAGISLAAILQKMQSLACPISVIPFNLAESPIPGQYQGRTHDRGRLRAKDARAERSEDHPGLAHRLHLLLREASLGPHHHPDSTGLLGEARGKRLGGTLPQRHDGDAAGAHRFLEPDRRAKPPQEGLPRLPR